MIAYPLTCFDLINIAKLIVLLNYKKMQSGNAMKNKI